MFATKSPGPDGFPPLFYQNYWNIIGPETKEACLNVLNNNTEFKNWNNTYIVLIPKVNTQG